MLSPTIRTEIRFLRGKGLSNRKISWMLGISKSSVANIMREPEPEPEPEYLKEPIRCTGCGVKIFITPCIKCSLT